MILADHTRQRLRTHPDDEVRALMEAFEALAGMVHDADRLRLRAQRDDL